MNQLRESASQLLRREKPSGQPEAHSYSITDRDGSTGTATDVRSDRGATDGGPVGDSAANVGTLVHAVLAQVELATFTDRDRTLDDAIGDAWDLALQETSLQEAELAQAAVPGADEDRVRRLLASARMSQVLLRAAGADIVRRELSVNGHRFDGPDLVVSQGSIDLLFGERTPPGHLQAEDACDPDAVRWTLVDYKTDSTSVSDEEFADRYRSQLAAYRALLDDAGIHVAETWLIRIGTDGVSDVQI
jgi:ATP-dependent exoDNAse (exonuclease V) beta subunit